MDWTPILGSAVTAALLTSFLNNAFLSWRDKNARERTAKGMLQRARSAATMLLESAKEAEYSLQVDVQRSFATVRDIMLSTEFVIATADLNLDEAYRSLETMQNALRTFEKSSEAYGALLANPNTLPMIDDEENEDFDPELAGELQTWEKWHGRTVKVVLNHAEKIAHCLESQQQALRTPTDYL